MLLNLYLLRLGHGPQFIGLMNAAGAGAYALFSAPAGPTGGRWGMRRPMIIGLILTAVSCGLLPTTQLILSAVSSTWLVVTYGASGIGTALYMVNGDAFLAGCTSSEERAHAFSALFALWPLAGFAGSVKWALRSLRCR